MIKKTWKVPAGVPLPRISVKWNLQLLPRHSGTFQHTTYNFRWQKSFPNLQFVTRWGESLFNHPLQPVPRASWYPICSFTTSIDRSVSSFYGWKWLLYVHACFGEFQEIYSGSEPMGLWSDGPNIPRFFEVVFCKLECVFLLYNHP